MVELSAVASAVADQVALLSAPSPEASSPEWVAVVGQTQELINQLTALQTVALAELAATEDVVLEDGTVVEQPRPVGHVRLDAPGLVSDLLGVSDQVATRRVGLAARMACCMPALVSAMASGRLDGYRAQVVAEELEDAPTGDARAVTDALADRLGEQAPGPLRARTRRVIGQLAPEVLRRRAERAATRRGLTRFTDLFGTDEWRGQFPVERARPAWAAVDELARQLRADGACATLEQARADALLQLILGQADVSVVLHVGVPDDQTPPDDASLDDPPPSDTDPGGTEAGPDQETRSDDGSGHETADEEPSATTAADDGSSSADDTPADRSDAPTDTGHADAGDDSDASADVADVAAANDVVVVRGFGVPGETFLSQKGLAELIERAGGCRVEAMRCHPDTGAVLAMTELAGRVVARQGYRPPQALTTLVRQRDGRCRFPGCHIAARFCDLDHVRPWPAGPTDASNLVCLCRRHHRIKQRPGWTSRLHPDGRVDWSDPTGRVRTTWPIDHLGATLPTDPVESTAAEDRPTGGAEDDTAQILARHQAALAADRVMGAEHPFREQVDERGWTWVDNEAFSVLEDTYHLCLRQHHHRTQQHTSTPDDRCSRLASTFPTARRHRYTDLLPPPF